MNNQNTPLNLPPDPRAQRRQVRWAMALIALALFCLLFGAAVYGGRWLLNRIDNTNSDGSPEDADRRSNATELVIAVSPAMHPTFDQLVVAFNEQAAETASDDLLTVRTMPVSPDKMVVESLESQPPFQALAPDSSLWFHQLEQQWADVIGEADETSVIPLAQRRTSTPVRYAVSPIVVVAWESVARELGWPLEPVGWQQIQRKATQDPDFKWNHPSTNNASGLLATLAEFYAGTGLTRGLTPEAATDPATLEYVRAVEATVRFYGEGEAVILERLAAEGQSFLDAFVAQEQVVLAWNAGQPAERLVAIYPAEGTLWADHPLALLELNTLSRAQRETYQAFVNFITSAEAQRRLLEMGYRPADLSIPLDDPASPFVNTDAVDWREPQTTLQMPAQQVVQVVQNVWWYTKRPTNVILVVDTSGSMAEGNKMESTREALLAFVENIRGDRDQVGLIEFGSDIKHIEPLRPLTDQGRQDFTTLIQELEPDGNTAMIDAVWEAHQQLATAETSDAINAIVVMSDGLENNSRQTVRNLEIAFQDSAAQRIVMFTVGFGGDADVRLLTRIAELGGGQFRRADETDIEELYRTISTYF